MNKIYIVLAILLLALFSCKNETNTEEQIPVGDQEKTISMTSEQINYTNIKKGKITRQQVYEPVAAKGEIIVPPDRIAHVNSSFEGNITQILVNLGQMVKKGTALAYFSHPDIIDLQNEYLRNFSEFEYLQKEYNRQKELVEENVTSLKNFEELSSRYIMTRNNMLIAEKKLELLNIPVSNVKQGKISSHGTLISPLSGKITQINCHVGSSVNNSILFEIMDLNKLMVSLSVFEKDIDKVNLNQEVVFGLSSTEKHRENTATVTAITSKVETSPRVVNVLATINKNSNELIPGMFVSAIVQTGKGENYVLPETAIVKNDNGESLVFYLKSGSLDNSAEFDFMLVHTGRISAGMVELVKFDETLLQKEIIIDGAYYLKSEIMEEE